MLIGKLGVGICRQTAAAYTVHPQNWVAGLLIYPSKVFAQVGKAAGERTGLV